VTLHEGDWYMGDCMNKAVDFRTPFMIESDLQHDGHLPIEASLRTE